MNRYLFTDHYLHQAIQTSWQVPRGGGSAWFWARKAQMNVCVHLTTLQQQLYTGPFSNFQNVSFFVSWNIDSVLCQISCGPYPYQGHLIRKKCGPGQRLRNTANNKSNIPPIQIVLRAKLFQMSVENCEWTVDTNVYKPSHHKHKLQQHIPSESVYIQQTEKATLKHCLFVRIR